MSLRRGGLRGDDLARQCAVACGHRVGGDSGVTGAGHPGQLAQVVGADRGTRGSAGGEVVAESKIRGVPDHHLCGGPGVGEPVGDSRDHPAAVFGDGVLVGVELREQDTLVGQ